MIYMLHKCNHVISYEDIWMQNIAWSRMVSSNSLPVLSLRKGVPTHFPMDNNDERQETFTGSGTTHDTNATLFQTPSAVERMLPSIGQEDAQPLNICDDFSYGDSVTVPPFYIGERVVKMFMILSGNVLDSDNELRNRLLLLRKSPDAATLEAVVSCNEFKELAHEIMDVK
eukprot:gene14961-16503_t